MSQGQTDDPVLLEGEFRTVHAVFGTFSYLTALDGEVPAHFDGSAVSLLLEDGDRLLLEDGAFLLLEDGN